MNCVSYTRSTNCLPEREDRVIPIMEQNDHIRKYVSSRKWKLVGKYSDRKHDPELDKAFLEMREDGVNRKFDCVVIDSIWQCGRDAFQAIALLRKTFYPAGIQFAVVEDNFCSADVGSEEVEKYLKNVWGKYHGRYTSERLGRHTVLRHLTVYGFVYDRENNVLNVDETSAAIIREIVERVAAGEKTGTIAKDLTSRNVETPSRYLERMCGEHKRILQSAWTTGAVYKIASNPKYCGRWEKTVDGKDLVAEAGRIVEPELFDKAMAQIASRNYSKPENRKHNGPSPVAGRIWDKESGLTLVKYSNVLRSITDIRFRYPKEKDIKYEKTAMDYDEFMERVAAELCREKQECLNVCEKIYSYEGRAYVDQLLAKTREPFPGLLKRIGEVESRKMACYVEFRDGIISEVTYKKKKGAYQAQLKRLDAELEEILQHINKISLIYSDRNPWILLYRYMNEEEKLTRKHAFKYIDKILVNRFEALEMVPFHKDWKDAFPKDWLEGGCDGAKE